METAVIRKIKRAGYSIAAGAYVLDEDEFGTWLFSPAGSMVRFIEGDEEIQKPWPNFLALAQPREWWFAGWWIRESGATLGTDACTPPTLVDGHWFWTDLELDVLRDSSGTVWVEDQDEFDDAVAAGQIPADEQRAAIAVTAELERRLRDHIAPFDLETGWRRHDAAIALGLEPLDLPVI